MKMCKGSGEKKKRHLSVQMPWRETVLFAPEKSSGEPQILSRCSAKQYGRYRCEGRRIRTFDQRLKRPLLYQLSYTLSKIDANYKKAG